ncbi:MAG: PAS domain-containing sensor histidine kinase [Aquincola tertiaricarbonis]|uniref:PAS domain-containing sensor histidine kinase n=1 Tax=Aquincola sp. J276 TaxID=2898432 RepID=UPI002150A56F|nr:PAS domain S-box protein [Aquincola sp. J276]MCR5868455.1 PAS domain S-box protein [Aquincola sp. J276]
MQRDLPAGQSYERLWREESPDALVVLSVQGEVMLWNRMAEVIFGYTPAQAEGRLLTDLIVPADRIDEELAARRDAEAQDVLLRAALRCHRDGRLLYVDIGLRSLASQAGPGGFVMSCKDVTTFKVARDARQVEQRYRDLLESVPDAIIIVNQGGRIVLFNGQAERIFGWSRTEMVGASMEMLLPQRYRSAHFGHRMRYHRAPQLRNMGAGLELYGLRRDGQEFPVEISLSPLTSEDDDLVMSAIRDISERKQTETALQKMNAELRVANQAKDRFLATMSHELRTPLNAILGFTGILLMRLPGEINPEQEHQLGIVKSSAEHLLSLINDLLDLAKIQAGMYRLSPELVDVGALLQEVHAQLQPLAQAKTLALEVSVPREPLLQQADRRALRQIVINFVNNAIKFTDRGSVRMAAGAAQPADAAGPAWRVDVVDDGIGISAEDQARLFAAFTQVGDPRRRPDGTGMGLHVCATLATLMGGRIEVESQPGAGSRFSLVMERC